MAAAAETCPFEIAAVAVGENLPDRFPVRQHIQANRRLRVLDRLRPPGNQARVRDIDEAAQLRGTGS